MKNFKTSSALIIFVLTLFLITNANAGGCSSHIGEKTEIEGLSDCKKCIDAKEKELSYEVEA